MSQVARSSVARAEVRYRFGPHPQGGFILGFRLPQLGGFIAAGALGIALMSLGGFLAILLIGVDALLAIGVLVITWRGHTLEAGTPLCLRFLTGRPSGRHRFRSVKPRMGHTSRLSGAGGLDPQPVQVPTSLPVELAELELLEGELPRHGGAPFGAVKDGRAHTYTATLMCQSTAFYLLSAADRESRLAAYGSVLAALARDHGPTRRIAWYERTLPPG